MAEAAGPAAVVVVAVWSMVDTIFVLELTLLPLVVADLVEPSQASVRLEAPVCYLHLRQTAAAVQVLGLVPQVVQVSLTG